MYYPAQGFLTQSLTSILSERRHTKTGCSKQTVILSPGPYAPSFSDRTKLPSCPSLATSLEIVRLEGPKSPIKGAEVEDE